MKKRRPDGAETAERSIAQIRQWLPRAAPILLVIGAWFLLHPYRGIVHDARLYAAQALRELSPEIFDRDLFFAFGSQDEFTLFTKLFAPLIDAAGLSAAAMAVVVFGHVLWLSGAATLATRLAGTGAAAFTGLLLLAGLPSSYGGWQAFSFGEGFATPRLLAEGLGMWALWALSRNSFIAAGALAAASGLLHPIMCATVLFVGLTFLILRDRRWIAAAVAGVLAVAAGAYFGIAPFNRVLQTMDAEWLAIVEPRNAYLFPGLWRPSDWSMLAIALAMSLASAAVLSGWRRSFMLSVAAAATVGMAITFVGADLLHNVLAIQLQLYRTIWLLNVVAYLGAGGLLVRVWQLKEDGYAIVALLAFGSFVTYAVLPPSGAAIVALGLVVAILRLRGRLGPLPRYARALPISLAMLLGVGLLIYRVVSVSHKIASSVPDGKASVAMFTYVTVIDVAIIAIAVMALLRYRPAVAKLALPVIALVVFTGALVFWDRQDAWPRVAFAHGPARQPDWSLPVDAQVFWENDAGGPWFVLRRPSYVSTTQGAGIAFGRDTALTFRRRIDVVQPLMQLEMIDIFRLEKAAHGVLPALDRTDLVAACGRDSELDALVLSRAVEGSYTAAWDTPVPIYDEWSALRGIAQPAVRRLYLYLCEGLRR